MRKTLITFSVLLFATLGLAAPSAATTQSSALGCQSTYATLHTYGGPLSWNCHGSKWLSPPVISARFTAGGWSGAIYSIEYPPRYFCDGDSFGLGNRKVYEVYLNETKPARCK